MIQMLRHWLHRRALVRATLRQLDEQRAFQAELRSARRIYACRSCEHVWPADIVPDRCPHCRSRQITAGREVA